MMIFTITLITNPKRLEQMLAIESTTSRESKELAGLFIRILNEQKHIDQPQRGNTSEPIAALCDRNFIDVINKINETCSKSPQLLIELPTIISNLPEVDLIVLHTKIANYIKKLSIIDEKNSIRPTVSKFCLILYEGIKQKIKTGDIYVLLLLMIHKILISNDFNNIEKGDIEYLKCYKLKRNWSGPPMELSYFHSYLDYHLITEDNVYTRFWYNNDRRLSCCHLTKLKNSSRKTLVGEWFVCEDLFRYWWSFAKYEQLTMDEFLLSLNSYLISKFFRFDAKKHKMPFQCLLVVSRINYFILKYPESIKIICDDTNKYYVASLTLCRICQSQQPNSLDETIRRLLLGMFRKTNLSSIPFFCSGFLKICETGIKKTKARIKSNIKYEYINNFYFTTWSVIDYYYDLCKLHLEEKRADDTALMFLLNSDNYQERHKRKDVIDWYQASVKSLSIRIIPTRLRHLIIFGYNYSGIVNKNCQTERKHKLLNFHKNY